MMRIHALVLIVSAALLAGCGRSETAQQAGAAMPVASTPLSTAVSPAPPLGDIDSCSLIARADLEPIFGALKVAGRSDRGLRGEHDCRFTNTEGQWLKLSVYSADRWELEKGIVSEQHPESLASIGDEAFRVKQGTDSVVYVRKGTAILETSCSCGLAKAEQVARRAITHM
jgi:hypothetical protein